MKKKTEKKTSKENGFKANLFSLKGEKIGVLALPEEIFFRNPNEKLVAQAVRVFLAKGINQEDLGPKRDRKSQARRPLCTNFRWRRFCAWSNRKRKLAFKISQENETASLFFYSGR